MTTQSSKHSDSQPRFELPLRIFTRLIFVGAIAAGASSLLSDRTAVSTLLAGKSSTGSATPSDDRNAEPKTANLSAPAPVKLPDPSIAVAVTQASVRGDQPVPLGVSVSDAGDAASNVVIRGLVPGSKLTVGEPLADNAWQVAIADLNSATVVPPNGFAGTMVLTFELGRPDHGIVDRKDMRVEWLAKPVTVVVQSPPTPPKPVTIAVQGASAVAKTVTAPVQTSPAPHIEASEVNRLLERGEELLKDGKIAAARSIFEYVADAAGEGRAAFLLAETYDPAVLEQIGAKGVSADLATAQSWYEKAALLGSNEASNRLEKLASQTK